MRKNKFIRIENPKLIELASNGTIIFYGMVDRDYGRTYCFKTTDKYNPNYVDTFYIHDTVYYGEHDVEMFQIEYDRNGIVGMQFLEIAHIIDLRGFIHLLKYGIWIQHGRRSPQYIPPGYVGIPYISVSVMHTLTSP